MKLKRFGAALVLVFVLGAVTAGNAFADHRVTTKEEVKARAGKTAGTTTVLTGKQPLTIALTSATAALETEVGTTPLKLTSKKLECASCVLFNEGGGAKGQGEVTLKGVTVASPATCKVSGESIRIEFHTDYTWVSESGIAATRFEPVTGKTTLATIKLEKGTGECPISGSYELKGAFFAEDANATGVYATSQPIQTSGTINKELGGAEMVGALEFGSKPATLTASVKLEAEGLFFGFE